VVEAEALPAADKIPVLERVTPTGKLDPVGETENTPPGLTAPGRVAFKSSVPP
jgi:hypothetical protein